MTLTERLEGIIKTIEMDGGPPLQITKQWLVLSAEAGVSGTKSDYLLLPAEIGRALKEDIGIDLRSRDVSKFCHLVIERNGETPCIKVVYELRQKPRIWRNKE